MITFGAESADGDSKQLQSIKLSTQLFKICFITKTSAPFIKIPENGNHVQYNLCCICARYHSSCSKIEGKAFEDIHNFTLGKFCCWFAPSPNYSKHLGKINMG